jgi:uncharacterized membrane protein YhhN
MIKTSLPPINWNSGILFLVFSALNLFGRYFDYLLLADLSKPLIIPSLFLFYYMNSERRDRNIFIALVFSLIGDILLIFNGNTYFIIGLLSFLIGQVFYIIFFFPKSKGLTMKYRLLLCVPFLFSYSFLVYLLHNDLGDLLVPILIYGFILFAMGLTTVWWGFKELFLKYTRYVVWGAVLFLLSDALLATAMFIGGDKSIDMLVMLTYIFAQGFIIFGIVKNERYELEKKNSIKN